MATRTEYQHGEFSWVNLGTTDAAAAKRFYGGLFGWQFNDMPAGPNMTYTFCELGHQSVGGLFAITPEMQGRGVPAHWIPYITVRSADEIAKRAVQHGGKVLQQPADVLDAGRSATIQDPTGARVEIWERKKHAGAELVSAAGAMSWNELHTRDVEAAGRFYRAVFDWKGDAVPMPGGGGGSYTIFKAGDTMIAGMTADSAGTSNWLTYFGVNDCDAAAATARELGAAVLQPPTDIPGIGRFSVCRDGQGAVFAVVKFIPPA